jgi:hypothetical protein
LGSDYLTELVVQNKSANKDKMKTQKQGFRIEREREKRRSTQYKIQM